MVAKRAIIFARSCFCNLISGFFRRVPQAMQKLLFSCFCEVHLGHGFALVFVVNIVAFNIFSDIVKRRRVPRKMRTQPPSRWKTCIASSIPYWLPMRTIMVILRMLRA